MPDPERTQFVTEACLGSDMACVALLAHWYHEAPRSPGLSRLIYETRNKPAVSLDMIRAAAMLYRESPDGGGRESALTRAKNATDLFIRYHHHAAPFNREGLATLWRRCIGEANCLENRKLATQILGDFADSPRL